MASEPLAFATRVASRWPNNAGRKADIASGPGWLVSFAWLDADAPFSDYSGQDRTITLLDGPGFTLTFAPPRPDLAVRSRHVPSPFDGGWPAHCHIVGPCFVLNAMSDRAQWRHIVRVITAPEHLPAPPPGALAFLVDLTTKDALGLDGPVETSALPAAHILFLPVA